MLATERRLEAAIHEAEDTKDQLLRAGEYLFARKGIDGTKIGDINELAGQRNPSAVHYHFGSKQGLVVAILRRHQEALEVEVGRCLDGLDGRRSPASVRDVVGAMVRPLTAELESASGRDFLRIVPQFIAPLDANLRKGVVEPVTTQSRRVLGLLEDRMTPLPQAIRRERLVTYTLVLTGMLADRARHLEDRQPTALDADQFLAHLLDVIEAVMTAPSSVR